MYNSITFWIHVRRVHAIDADEYRRQKKEYYVSVRKWLCKICYLPITHDYGKWLRHIKNHHFPLDIPQYFDIYEAKFEE